MLLVTLCDRCDLSLCVSGSDRVTLATIYNVVYLLTVVYFFVVHYCVVHIVSCIMTVTCMFNRVVFVLTNKSTCVIRSVVRRTDSCRYRQEDPSPLSILTRDNKMKDIHIPNFLLNNVLLTRVTKYKYLGHCISDDLSDDDDMARQYRQIYAQGNALLRNFFRCTESVKITLFRSFCTSLYTCELWCSLNH